MIKKLTGIVFAAALALSSAGCANLPASTQTFITDVENAAFEACSVLPDVVSIVALISSGNVVISTDATYIAGLAKSLCAALAPPSVSAKLKMSTVPVPVTGTITTNNGKTIVIHGTYYPAMVAQ